MQELEILISFIKGLYNGETADDIAKRKGLRYREEILDNIGSDELIANLFRISQTEQKLKRYNIKTELEACNTHNKIGKIIRKAIKEAGGKMPEDLPTPQKSLKELEKQKQTLINEQVIGEPDAYLLHKQLKKKLFKRNTTIGWKIKLELLLLSNEKNKKEVL